MEWLPPSHKQMFLSFHSQHVSVIREEYADGVGIYVKLQCGINLKTCYLKLGPIPLNTV
jgi:hypothetical protein